jgi:hypothetical protein
MSGFIVHDDVDGIVSGLFFKQFNKEYEYKGFYKHCYKGFDNEKSTSTFYLSSKLKAKDVGIDLDMNMMNCIGHHICPIKNDLGENPNKEYLNNFYEEYFEKCPLNTALLLVDKYKMKITNLKQIAILVYCDGFNIYFKKYTKNCKKWLDRYNLNYITEALENHYEEIQDIIDNEIVPIYNKTNRYVSLKLKVEDLQFTNKEIIKNFSRYVIDTFNLDVSEEMFDIDYCLQNEYIAKSYFINCEDDYLKIKENINNNSRFIVSAAMVSRKQINITMIKDLLLF